MEKQYIGGLYKAIGLNTPAEVVDRRLVAANAIFENLSFLQAESLVLVLFIGNVDTAAVKWLIDACQDGEPGFGASGIDRDVEIMAAVLLKDAIDLPKSYSKKLCMVIDTAAFGGKRACAIDANIPMYARNKLLGFQTEDVHMRHLEASEFYDYGEKFKAVDALAPANNINGAWPLMKEILEDSISSSENMAEAHSEKINELVTYVKRIEEQIQTQWFAISKWSKSASVPFMALNIGEAVTRAAFELSKIVHTNIGPAAAPALLNMALSDVPGKSKNEELSFIETCTAAPIAWRRSWLKLDTRTAESKLTPILAAFAIAAEANDEADWCARFKREVDIDPDFKINPLDFSLQLFHELLIVSAKG